MLFAIRSNVAFEVNVRLTPCEEVTMWCYDFNFALGNLDGWQVVNGSVPRDIHTVSSHVSNTELMRIDLTFPDMTLTDIEINYVCQQSGNGGSRFVVSQLNGGASVTRGTLDGGAGVFSFVYSGAPFEADKLIIRLTPTSIIVIQLHPFGLDNCT